ncbi:MAG: class I SAM-dependent methyltransferase [Chloroflexaceae bacterium]|nr:class I SAM-dependent methyltransferase [Chloroflexaceae bacterium]
MSYSETQLVQQSLARPEIHQRWNRVYLSAENDRFFDLAFAFIAHELRVPAGAAILDAGCGNGAHAVRLARHGFRIHGLDFSASVLPAAQATLATHGMGERISLQQGNLLALPFADGTFGAVVCWGVLMHIPEMERALDELVRVLQPGGQLVIGENNMYSLESVARRGLNRLLRRSTLGGDARQTAAGVEYWSETPVGALLTRDMDMGWLVRQCQARGLHVQRHVARQFTQLYSAVGAAWLKRLIHLVNHIWFRFIRLPGPARATS